VVFIGFPDTLYCSFFCKHYKTNFIINLIHERQALANRIASAGDRPADPVNVTSPVEQHQKAV
jgi:hypothetical protein